MNIKMNQHSISLFPIDGDNCISIEQLCMRGTESYNMLVNLVKTQDYFRKYDALMVSPHKHDPCKILMAYLHALDANAIGKRRAKYMEFEILMRVYGVTQISSLLNKLKEYAKQTQYACLYLISVGQCSHGIHDTCDPSAYINIAKAHIELTT